MMPDHYLAVAHCERVKHHPRYEQQKEPSNDPIPTLKAGITQIECVLRIILGRVLIEPQYQAAGRNKKQKVAPEHR